MNTISAPLDLGLNALQQQYLQGDLLPSACIASVLERIALIGRAEIWIARVPDDVLLAQARLLDALIVRPDPSLLERMPLFGLPFAVKDNIDVAGMPTTVACPDFRYLPSESATVVGKLLAAGAILIGKTNLDQFATGLVGTRSPYGAVRNAIDPRYVSGGSSSGSGVAVALDLVTFALGTDTAGSGRVPAGFNDIVGLKPSRGLLSNHGVFPACRTLDCVAVFARSAGDAWGVTSVAAGFDARDAYSRRIPMAGVKTRGYRIAVPARPEFFGDKLAENAYRASLDSLAALPDVRIDTVDFTPFQAAAQLLYQGPWVAERLAAIGDFFQEKQSSMDPVVAGIIAQGANFTAAATFQAQYRLAELRRQAELLLLDADFMLVPTTPTMPTIAAVAEEPVKRNAELGYYTNFVNFFDMAAIAVPGKRRADGLPAGVTLIGPCGTDQRLAAAAQTFAPLWQDTGLPLRQKPIVTAPLPYSEPTMLLAVVGAHLSGQPLNWQLLECGARLRESTSTAPHYRLHALAGTTPPKPGLERVAKGGAAIAVEIWELPMRRVGEMLAEVPPPLAIGSLEVADGRWIKGFVCEPWALLGAQDISRFGGWRNYVLAHE